jgi:hypothetical protein
VFITYYCICSHTESAKRRIVSSDKENGGQMNAKGHFHCVADASTQFTLNKVN